MLANTGLDACSRPKISAAHIHLELEWILKTHLANFLCLVRANFQAPNKLELLFLAPELAVE